MFISRDLKSFLQSYFSGKTVFIPRHLYSHVTDSKLLLQGRVGGTSGAGLEGVQEEEGASHSILRAFQAGLSSFPPHETPVLALGPHFSSSMARGRVSTLAAREAGKGKT
jgi:hypothetical protein